ncbi:ion transporter [Methanolobus halotolerans]|uniref:Ion transporter n=1 Tax=Methanolobus halotolerans TaxID=2052935 RepID=A0A4E0Q4V0_9EURY|nr:ion transporter [Methanolobus halotolerans]TGC09015.1 ion transporter [Methanolobus halotolerans]
MPELNNDKRDNRPGGDNWKAGLYDIIFETDTPAGRHFDILLIISILLSVLVVMMDSVSFMRADYGRTLYNIEWFFTILFTIEYALRLISVRSKRRYATSLFGIVDLVAIIPTYLSILLPGSQLLLVVRILRVLRIFRVLKLVKYMSEADLLMKAMRASSRKITVFLFTVLALVTIMGSLVYLIEGEENGFTSIPVSIYWAIVTMTTVGYGDIIPQTSIGKALASFVMILGYSIIAVPTGIVTSEISFASIEERKKRSLMKNCIKCGNPDHDANASFCKLCGAQL